MSRPHNTFNISTIAGDGIGVEITEAAITVLNQLASSYSSMRSRFKPTDPSASVPSFSFNFERYDWSSENYGKRGWYMPDNWEEKLKRSDAIFFGAVGWPCMYPFIYILQSKSGQLGYVKTFR